MVKHSLGGQIEQLKVALDKHHACEVPLHNRKLYDLTGTVERPEKIVCKTCGQNTMSRQFEDGESE